MLLWILNLDFAASGVVAVVEEVAAAVVSGVPSRKIKVRRVMIGNELFIITSPEHERVLLEKYLIAQRKLFSQAIVQKKLPSVKKKLKLISTQITRVENRLKKADKKAWLAREDDEILLILALS